MTTYRGLKIERTSTTIGKELLANPGHGRHLHKIVDAYGHAYRNSLGNLPLIASIAAAKRYIDDNADTVGAD